MLVRKNSNKNETEKNNNINNIVKYSVFACYTVKNYFSLPFYNNVICGLKKDILGL